MSYLLTLLVSLLAAGAPLPAADGLGLRVMTFNIRYGTANDGEDRWERRRDLVFDVIRDIRKHRSDVVGLQEALRFPAVLRLKAAAFLDSFRAIHPDCGDAGTSNRFSGRRSGPKIDYILAPPGTSVLEAAIDHGQREGRYPSDHFPVTATVVLPLVRES